MATNDWRFVVVTGGPLGTKVGELTGVTSRYLTVPISRPRELGFTIPLTNSLAQYIEDGSAWIRAYRGGQILFNGLTTGIDETGDRDAQSMTVTCHGPAWYFAKRVVGKDPSGRLISGVSDRAWAAETLFNDTDFEFATEIDHDLSYVSAGGSLTDYNPGPYRILSEAIAELSEGLDGFEWEVDAQENNAWVGAFVAEPVFGTVAADVVFEYTDDGKGINNVESYKRVLNRDSQANRVWVVNQGQGSQMKVAVHYDSTSITNWNCIEDVVHVDLTDPTLMLDLAEEHVRVRKNPKVTYEFTPHIDPSQTGRVPVFGTNFNLGDTIRLRVRHGGRTRFDIGVRVWAVRWDIGDDGIERMTFTVQEENT